MDMIPQKELLKLYQERYLKFFLDERKKVYTKIDSICKKNNCKLVFITQPHPFRQDYLDKSRLTFPVVNSLRLNLKQSQELFDVFNNNTREFACENNVLLVDFDSLFYKRNIDGLFYDGIHYSEKGAIVLGNYINAKFKKMGLIK